MYPEVQKYIDAANAAQAAYGAVANVANKKHADRYNDNDVWERWNAETSAADTARRIATNEAWNGLTASSDPLVRYIAAECKDYQEQALVVLRALPAPLETLDALAEEYDWCSIWNRFRDAAETQGLFGEAKPQSESRQALTRWIKDDYGLGRSHARRLNTLVDAVVAEAVAEATATTDATAAEAPASV